MATIIFTSILAVACAFMFYALLKFHDEVSRPPRAMSRFSKRVIILQRSRESNSPVAASRRRTLTGEIPTSLDRADSGELNDELPFGVRRLAVKRMARS
jgi:hypothetical protein